MSNGTLIILFGHANDCWGELSAVARSRCETAVEVLRQLPNAKILPTGAFGAHFNRTDMAHASYLTEYLVKEKGVSAEGILPGTDSSNTFEDCLCARKVALDNDFTDIVAVTSDYHAARVQFVMERVFRGIRFSLRKSPTPPHSLPAQTQDEAKRFKRLKKDWIAPLLYQKNEPFPDSVYEAAANDQRHYDAVSLAAVTAIVVVTAFPFLSEATALVGAVRVGSFWTAAVIDLFLLSIYERSAQTARAARRTMRGIEIGYDRRGFSASYDPERLFGRLPLPIRTTVFALSFLLIVILIALGTLRMVSLANA